MGLLRFCVIQAAMDLFDAMVAKGLIGVAWGAWAEWRDSRKESVLDEQGGCYHASQPFLRLPPPEDTP